MGSAVQPPEERVYLQQMVEVRTNTQCLLTPATRLCQNKRKLVFFQIIPKIMILNIIPETSQYVIVSYIAF
jgi:hypothetical protein